MEFIDKIKQFFKNNEPDLVLALGVILISLISFAAGRLTAPALEKQPIEVEYLKGSSESALKNSIFGQDTQVPQGADLDALSNRVEGMYVASKNSTKYHLPECTGAKRIAEHNKIWFISKEEAESMGYEPAANCPGLKLE